MVSKASEDLPEPETPVTTVKVLCGTSKSMFLRLWTRAPRTTMLSVGVEIGLVVSEDICIRAPAALLALSAGAQRLPRRVPNLSIIREVVTAWCAGYFG